MTSYIDFLTSPFQILKNEYGIINDSRSVSNMLRYYIYLQTPLHTETRSIFIAEQLQETELINSMMSRYKNCTFNPKLFGNSANAKATFIKVQDLQDNIQDVFLKFQVKESADDIRYDAFNAFLIQLLNPSSPHYIKPIDLFKTFISNDDRWYLDDYIGNKLLIIIKDKRIDVPLPEPLKFPHIVDKRDIIQTYYDVVKEHNFKIATVLTAKQIVGPSLDSSIYNLDKNNLEYYMTKLKNLFTSMIHLGKYGFVHNDAHTNNILFNLEEQEFSLIDYGRVSFYTDYINEKINTKLNQYIEWVGLHTDPNYLTKYIKFYIKNNRLPENLLDYNRLLSQLRYINHKYVLNMTDDILSQKLLIKSLVLFDISTTTLGIIDNIVIPKPHKNVHGDVRDIFKEYFYDTDIIHISGDNIFIREFNELSKLIETTPLVDELKQVGLDVLLPGILWASFMFTSLYEVNPTNSMITKIQEEVFALAIDRHQLKNFHYMHYYYQYSPSFLYNCKKSMFKYLPIAIKYILDIFNLNLPKSEGGMLSSRIPTTRISRIPMSVRSLRSQYTKKKQQTPVANGQLESVAIYNRTDTPPVELTDWLNNYRPKTITLKPSNHLFGSLEDYLEKTERKNKKFHPLVEELKKYKPNFEEVNVPGYKRMSRKTKNGDRSR